MIILLQSYNEITREWFYQFFSFVAIVINGRGFPLCNAFKNSNTQSFLCFTTELCCAKNGSALRKF